MFRTMLAVFHVCLAALFMSLASACLAQGSLGALGDEFNDPRTMQNWSRLYQTETGMVDHMESIDIGATQAGFLTMRPLSSVWYMQYRGELTYKLVSGDFVVTTEMHVSNRARTGAPTASFSLGGLMIRAPRNVPPPAGQPDGENYLFLSVGSADSPGNFQLEMKTTTNNNSVYDLLDAGAGEGTLQVARIGDVYILLGRPTGGQWYVLARYWRNDLPSTLQVGMTSYTDWDSCRVMEPAVHDATRITWGHPDLEVGFDFVRFQRPVVPSEFANRDLSDTQSVSDDELLQFLGDNGMPH